MDYKKIYKDLIVSRKKLQEYRKNNKIICENHHIIPVFMFKNNSRLKNREFSVGKRKSGHLEGDCEDELNKILLTPKEHFICHILLYKMFYGKKYGVQCGAALYMFFKHNLKNREEIFNSNQYQKYKEIGIKCLSEKQKGKIPARDQITGELVGHVSVNHPNILSGRWAHHHKGRKRSDEFCAKRKKASSGKGNSNYKNFTEDEVWEHLYNYVTKYKIENEYIFFTDWIEKCVLFLKHKHNFKKLSPVSICNRLNLHKPKDIIKKFNIKYNKSVKYDKWAKRRRNNYVKN